MAQSVIQTSFAAGEISSNLLARIDLDKYQTGAFLMRNFFVDYRGGASTRPGTETIDRTKNPAVRARLIPFIFSQEQSYVLELGEQYMRFLTGGSQLLETGSAITMVTQAPLGLLTVIAHGLTSGDTVYVQDIVGMIELNNITYIALVVDADHITLTDLDGNDISTVAYTPYVSGGLVSEVYEITTPWAAADLPKLKFTQSADVMTFVHPDYPIQNLSRLTASTFSLTPEVIGTTLPAPNMTGVSTTSAGNLEYQYIVCAVGSNGERSPPSNIVGVASAALNPTAVAPIVTAQTWDPVADVDHYDVFKTGPVFVGQPQPTFFGYIGSTTDTSFTDNNIAPDFSNGPPQSRNPFSGGNYPGCVAYFQQRRVYGGLKLSPEEFDASRVGAYSNFDVAFAVLDSDAIQAALASRQVNEIKSMVPTASGLVVLTTGGAFQLSGGSATAAISPTNVVALPQASSGANDLPPIVVNYDILFVQAKGSIVRDLAYNFYLQTFYGYDRSALSNHLFFNYQLKEWAWAEEPFKIIWVVRDDGRLLSLTYVPEQEIYGWAQHDTQGLFESVCVVPEGDEDVLYAIVQRPLGIGTVRYIERMASRKWNRVEDVWCVDAGVKLQLDRPTFALDMTASTTTAFIQAASGTPFDASWIGKIIWFDVGGKLRVETVDTVNQITCSILEPLANNLPNTDPAAYYRVDAGAWEVGPEVTTLRGLGHLRNQEVAVLADGSSVGPLMVSEDGAITLPSPASKVLAGLPYTAQILTLYLDVGEPTIQGRRKKISAVTLRLDQTRGLKWGSSFDDYDLMEFKELLDTYTPPKPLVSQDERITIAGPWMTNGQVYIQQDQPFPATVLGVIPEVTLGDTQT